MNATFAAVLFGLLVWAVGIAAAAAYASAHLQGGARHTVIPALQALGLL